MPAPLAIKNKNKEMPMGEPQDKMLYKTSITYSFFCKRVNKFDGLTIPVRRD
jgi:hypothetical protein